MHLDLHRHLEGSHSPAALATVARDLDLRKAPFFDLAHGRYRTPDELREFLTVAGPSDDPGAFYGCIVAARAAYVSVAAIGALAEAAMREAADDADGIDLRLSLFSMARTLVEHDGRVWREVAPVEFASRYAEPILAAVVAARERAVAATGVPIALRLGLSRTFESAPHYQALAAMVIEQAATLVGQDVLGIVTGADREPMPAELVAIIDRLRPHLPDLTIHAGEFAGADAVARTLELRPNGIGHGVHALEDPAVLERLAASGVTLEVCPTSNLLLIPTAVAALEARAGATPLAALQRAGVRCVLGSDDPVSLGTTYRAELALAGTLGVDLARLAADSAARWTAVRGAQAPA
ncbi:MAG: hypothetical protein R3B06_27510 [Kofleriaceae bacterium]